MLLDCFALSKGKSRNDDFFILSLRVLLVARSNLFGLIFCLDYFGNSLKSPRNDEESATLSLRGSEADEAIHLV